MTKEAVVDAHQHFWAYNAQEFGWIAPDSQLARDYAPRDLRGELARCGVDRSIAVQARQCDEETQMLLRLAREHEWIMGVVGWIDLTDPDLAARLDELAQEPLLLGLRHVVQDEPDPRFLLRSDFQAGVASVLRAGFGYDLLVRACQLEHVPAFLRAVGPGRIIIDHGAKPDIRDGGWEPWAGRMAAIAREFPVYCKLSGLVTEAGDGWSADQIDRYMQHLIDCFGPERLIFGSDWPVCGLSASYEQVHALALGALGQLTARERAAVMGGNAIRAYARETVASSAAGEKIEGEFH